MAVDPGDHCGIAYFFGGELKNWELIDGYDAAMIGTCIRDFLVSCDLHRFTGVLVLEKPPAVLYRGARGGRRNLTGVGSVIGCRKLWLREWAQAGAVKRRVVHVHPSTWHARIYASTRGVNGAMFKQLAMNRVRAEYRIEAETPDVAEAILIGKWATYAGEVLAVLPKSRAA